MEQKEEKLEGNHHMAAQDKDLCLPRYSFASVNKIKTQ